MSNPIFPMCRTQNNESNDDDLPDMFADLDAADPFDLKKDQIATNLAALMAFCGKTRSEIAEMKGWKKSRVTTILSGRGNPTIQTIWEFCSSLGFDFDVVFRSFDEESFPQPWRKSPTSLTILPKDASLVKKLGNLVIDAQTPQEVARDLASGNHKSIYFSVSTTRKSPSVESRTITLQRNKALTASWSNIPFAIESPLYVTKKIASNAA